MKLKHIFSFCVCFGVTMFVTSCASTTKYETQTLKVYVDRESLEKMPVEDISVIGADMKRLTNEKLLNIGIQLTLKDETQGRAKLPPEIHLEEDAYNLAKNYLSRIKGYHVEVEPQNVSKDMLLTNREFQKKDYNFVLIMNVTLNSEIEERYDYDEAMFKTSIDWQLVDFRTKSNGLGSLDAPTIREALTCKNVTSRKLNLTSISGKRMAGSQAANAVNAYRNTLENALIEFRAQLANRIPFGGKIESFKELDGEVSMMLKSGTDHGITKRMQMLIINEEGDYIAVATAYPVPSGKTRLQVWRWLSPSIAKQIKSAAKSKTSEDWMDEDGNALYAVCLGLPSPPKDERDQIKDYE